MLTIYRRHTKECPHTTRRYRRCRCPIHVEGSLGGESIRRALDLTSWDAAENLIHEWSTVGRIGGRIAKSSSVEDAISLYLADAAARRLSAGSIARYRAFLERSLLPWCRANRLETVRDLSFEQVAIYRATWTMWSAYTSAKNLELLRMFLRFCVKARWMEENPAADLKSPKIQMAPTLPFDEEEERKILFACNLYRKHNRHGKRSPARLRAFVLALRYTGLRIGDVATLESKRLEGNSILLYTHKTGVPVYVPIPHYVAEELREQARLNSNPTYFFWTGESTVKGATVLWQRSLATLFEKAGVPNAYPHRYRDTFAVSLLLKGVSLEDVAVLLGHATPAITAKHYSPWVQARRQRLEEMVSKTWKEPPRPQLRLVKS
jgi:integrase